MTYKQAAWRLVAALIEALGMIFWFIFKIIQLWGLGMVWVGNLMLKGMEIISMQLRAEGAVKEIIEE